MHDINAVIVNWKMRDDIDRCLSSLFNDCREDNLNVIVHVMDNSENVDGVREMLAEKYPQVKYVNPGGNIGFGKAQNLGMGMADADFYLPLNPDVEFPFELKVLKNLIEFMNKNGEVGVVGPKLLNTDGTVQYSCFRFPGFFDQMLKRAGLDKKFNYFKKKVDYYLMGDFDHNVTVEVDWVMGSFMFVRGEMAKNIGFFDDRYFMYFEDCDWCRRAWRAGWKVFYVHDTVVRHGHRRDSDGGNQLVLLFKNKVSRIHLKSWLKYFAKWGIGKEHYGV